MDARQPPTTRRDIDRPRPRSILLVALLALTYAVLFAGCTYVLFFQTPDGRPTIGKKELLFERATVVRNDGLGAEWSLRAAVAGTGFSPGATIYLEPSDLPLQVAVIAIESSASYDDVGHGRLEVPSYRKGERYTQTVTVTETKGPDVGKSAVVEFVFVWE